MFSQNDAWAPVQALGHRLHRADRRRSVKIANEFKTALENNELHMVYQPIVDLAMGEVAGFEALMRWTHPTQGFISPTAFSSPSPKKPGSSFSQQMGAEGILCRPQAHRGRRQAAQATLHERQLLKP